MDRFVTRAPSWKTMNYGTLVAATRSSLGAAKKIEKKKPLQEQQQLVDDVVEKAGRLNIRDDRLFTARPLSSALSCNDSQSSSSSVDICRDENTENYSGKLSDYVSSSEDKSSTLTVSLTPPPNNPSFDALVYKNLDNFPNTPVSQQPQLLQSPSVPATPRQVLMARIQRDLNSPSATLRLRAMKALKSPSKSCYSHFDVAHHEQSLISPEERKTPPPAPTIQELMHDIIVYVEVRTGEDNRSAGVKKVISALGAKVNDKLLRDTTHVIFKDGLLSTFKKAKNWNIPVVSILWIEACKNRRTICDPKEFPISNIDRYENPELYDKMKRHKSMQPDSECNKRVRVKPLTGTPKDSTPKTAANTLKKTATLNASTPATASNKKTDISHYFKAQSNKKHVDMLTSGSSLEDNRVHTDSPATQLLNRINSNCFTPTATSAIPKQKPPTRNNDMTRSDDAGSTPKSKDAKKMLNFAADGEITKAVSQQPVSGRSRRSASIQAHMEATKNSIEEMSLSQTPLKDNCASDIVTPSTPGIVTRRRYSMRLSAQVSVSGNESNDTMTQKLPPPPRNKCALIPEKKLSTVSLSSILLTSSDEATPVSQTPSERTSRRRTTLNSKTLDISECDRVQLPKEKQLEYRRRTHYTPRKMDETLEQTTAAHDKVNPTNTTEPTAEQQLKAKSTLRRRTVHKAKETPTVTRRNPTKIYESVVEKQVKSQQRPMHSTQKVDMLSLKNLVVVTMPTSAHSSDAEVEILNSPHTSKPPKESIAANKQPTLHSSKAEANNSGSGTELEVTLTPLPEEEDSSTQLQHKTVAATPQQTTELQLEERTSALSFSSTRGPGRRRTFFDLSMDIITHRLQNINASTRRSIAVPTVGDLEVRRSSLDLETPVPDNSRSAIVCKEPASCGDASVDTCNKEPTGDDVAPIIKKKRKLFAPNNSLVLTPTAAPSSSSVSLTTPIATAKRRKTLLSLSQSKSEMKYLPPSAPAAASTTKKLARSRRRSTFDFVEPVKSNTSVKTASISTPFASSEQQTAEGAKKASKCTVADVCSKIDDSAGESTNSIALAPPKAKKQLPFMVYTNMHKEEIEVIRETLKKLGGFELEDCVSDNTTHLVSLEPRRTLNVLRALVRGLWILEYTWITDSLQTGHWLNEEQYELRDFSRAVEICRAERQAFGNLYKCELFSSLGAFYISSRCGHISKADLNELITLCGGNVVDQRKRAKYILGNANRLMDDKVYITPYWVLDSITQMQLLRFQRYTFSQKPLLTQTQPSQTPIQIQRALQQARNDLDQLNV